MISTHSDSGMHISQLGIPTASASAGLSSVPGSGVQDGGLQAQKLKKSKLQLWNDLKISGMFLGSQDLKDQMLTPRSYHQSFHPCLYPRIPYSPHSYPAKLAWSSKLLIKCGVSCHGSA